jgi:hypothetical protein
MPEPQLRSSVSLCSPFAFWLNHTLADWSVNPREPYSSFCFVSFTQLALGAASSLVIHRTATPS